MGASAKVGMLTSFAEKITMMSTKPSWMTWLKNGLPKGKSGIW